MARWPLLASLVMGALATVFFSDRGVAAEPQRPEQVADRARLDFFEKKIRPVLVKHCYRCHAAGAKSIQGGLRVDTRDGLLTGGDTGPAIVPGKPQKSLLLSALRQEGPEMPPAGRLPARVIADFEEWIRSGATDPRTGKAVRARFDLRKRVREHWAWRPLQPLPQLPPAYAIDFFIDRRLRARQIRPAPPADPTALLRRLKFDLLGLPPTPAEIAAFLKNPADDAYERQVDQWLQSPRFGEKWAVLWLDMLRYAETKGHVTDQGRPFAWKYRDYLIAALNADVPYDRLVLEHVAGDLLPPSLQRRGAGGQTNVSPTATGALFTHEMHFMAVDPVKQRWDEIDAQIDTLGKAFLGLTMGCARCHDHKFDAIRQQDYYALAGFFYSTEQGTARTAPRTKLPPSMRAEVAKREANYRRFLERKVAQRRKAQTPKAYAYFPISEELGIQSPRDYRQQMTQIRELLARDPSWGFWVRAAKDVRGRDVPLLIRGDPRKPGTPAPRDFLAALRPPDSRPPQLGEGSGRLWLARQLVANDNPLTPRVWVNRLWQQLLGRGLVATPNDFGNRGARPTHPQLLDYLARRLRLQGWSTKAVVREIVLSRAYRRSSRATVSARERDPDNRWLARQNRRRLAAEFLRDSLLAVSGRLTHRGGGPSTPPYVPPYATANKPSNVPPSGPLDGDGRRSVYLEVRRNFIDPLLRVFDFPDRGKSVGKRHETNVPNQALALLNSPFVQQQARFWGQRVQQQPGPPLEKAERMFLRAVGRPPTDREREELQALLKQLQTVAPTERWTDVAHVLFNLAEFSVVE